MIPLIHFFTLWAILLSTLEKWTGVSFFPSLIISLFTSTFLAVYYNLPIAMLAINTIIHLVPLSWSQPVCNLQVFMINIAVAFLYLSFIQIKDTTAQQIYQEQFRYLSHQTVKSLIDTHANICVFDCPNKK